MDETYEAWQTRLAKRQAGIPWNTIAGQEGIHVNTFRDGRKRAERKGWLLSEAQLPPAVRRDGRRVGRTATAAPGENLIIAESMSTSVDMMSANMVSASLTPAESQSLTHYEEIIAQGLQTFVEVGQALLSIRDQRLYRETYRTFEEYLHQRWDMSRPRAYQLIEASVVVEHLSTNVDTVPVNEAQARPLTRLAPEQQQEVWREAVETAPPSGITAKHVQTTVTRVKERTSEHKTSKPKAPAPEPQLPARQRVQDGLFAVLSWVEDKDAWKMLGDLAQQLSFYAEEHEDPNLMQRMEQALSPLWHMIEDHEQGAISHTTAQ
jgi:hypothetical protein